MQFEGKCIKVTKQSQFHFSGNIAKYSTLTIYILTSHFIRPHFRSDKLNLKKMNS